MKTKFILKYNNKYVNSRANMDNFISINDFLAEELSKGPSGEISINPRI